MDNVVLLDFFITFPIPIHLRLSPSHGGSYCAALDNLATNLTLQTEQLCTVMVKKRGSPKEHSLMHLDMAWIAAMALVMLPGVFIGLRRFRKS
jgi:hypothetical protein